MNKIAAIKALRQRGIRVCQVGDDGHTITNMSFAGKPDLHEAKDIVELVLHAALKDETPRPLLDQVLALPLSQQDRLVKTVLDRRIGHMDEVYQHIARARTAMESLLESNDGCP